MNLKAYVAEFIGAFALIFVGVAAITINHMENGGVGILGIAFAHGLTIAVMASATMAISGGHLNPAVTVGALITGKIDLPNAVGYIISQCAGAIVAALAITAIFSSIDLAAVSMGTPLPGSEISPSAAFLMEIILTFFLMFVIYGTAIDARAPKMSGLFIGMTITLCILAGGVISGAAMNPARFFGPAIVGGELDFMWLYWIGPIIGSSLAALVYHHLLEEN